MPAQLEIKQLEEPLKYLQGRQVPGSMLAMHSFPSSRLLPNTSIIIIMKWTSLLQVCLTLAKTDSRNLGSRQSCYSLSMMSDFLDSTFFDFVFFSPVTVDAPKQICKYSYLT